MNIFSKIMAALAKHEKPKLGRQNSLKLKRIYRFENCRPPGSGTMYHRYPIRYVINKGKSKPIY